MPGPWPLRLLFVGPGTRGVLAMLLGLHEGFQDRSWGVDPQDTSPLPTLPCCTVISRSHQTGALIGAEKQQSYSSTRACLADTVLPTKSAANACVLMDCTCPYETPIRYEIRVEMSISFKQEESPQRLARYCSSSLCDASVTLCSVSVETDDHVECRREASTRLGS